MSRFPSVSRQTWIAYALLVPGLGLILLFMVIVFGMVVSQSFGYFNFSSSGGFSWRFWQEMLAERQLWFAFFYSLRIALLSALLALVVAYPLALWLRKPFQGSNLIGSLLKAPLLVHGLVAAFLYVNFISYHGFLNLFLIKIGLTDHPIRMQNDPDGIGVVILQVWKQMPFALLLLSGAVKSIGDDLIDAARDLGAGAWMRLIRVILPLTLRTLQVALVIIFIGAAGDYSFQTIAGPTQVNSLAQLMYRTQNESADGWNQAAVVALMLMVAALLGSALLALGTARIVKWGARR
jgi:putative spermidine/putrescine transport system permease protein